MYISCNILMYQSKKTHPVYNIISFTLVILSNHEHCFALKKKKSGKGRAIWFFFLEK